MPFDREFHELRMVYKTLRKHFEVEFLVGEGVFLEKGAIYQDFFGSKEGVFEGRMIFHKV